jgi:hypothetical protein
VSRKTMLILAAAAAAVVAFLVFRRKASAAPVSGIPSTGLGSLASLFSSGPAGVTASGAIAGASTPNSSKTSKPSTTSAVIKTYAAASGAAATAVCQGYTAGAGGPLCSVAGSVQSKFTSVVTAANVKVASKVGGLAVSGVKKLKFW